MSSGNYIQTIKRMQRIMAKQESEIARLKNDLSDKTRIAFEKIDILEKTIYWLNKRSLWWRILNKQPKHNKGAA